VFIDLSVAAPTPGVNWLAAAQIGRDDQSHDCRAYHSR
jgi:hypothetical protein